MAEREYVTVGDRSFPLKTAAERKRRASSGGISLPSPTGLSRVGRRWAGRATPGGFTRYARQGGATDATTTVPAALLLFALVAGLRMLRRGTVGSARQVAGLLIASLVIAVAASFAPELVVAFLAALLFVVALDETDRLTAALRWLNGLITTPARTPAGSGFSPR